MGVIDYALSDIADINSGLVMICSPLSTYKDIFRQLASRNHENIVISDIGSVKEYVNNLASEILPNIMYKNFVAGHPIAGSEKNGVLNSNENIFQDKLLYLTPTLHANNTAIDLVSNIWKIMGANVQIIDAKRHDKIYAIISHLVQILIFTYDDLLSNNIHPLIKEPSNCLYFNKFIRLRHSNINMWRDIIYYNKQNINDAIEQFVSVISQIMHELDVSSNQNNKLESPRLLVNSESIDCNNSIVSISEDDNILEDVAIDELIVPYIIAKTIYRLASENNILDSAGSGFADVTSILKYANLLDNHILHYQNKESLEKAVDLFSDKLRS